MRRIKKCVCPVLAFSLLLLLTACWNYREIDRMAIVAGVAVDKGTTAKYEVTIELIQISHEKEARTKSRIVTAEGESIFDAARNAISVAGKKLYWSHAKVIVISQDIAEDGVAKVLDWYIRDSETRADVRLLISGEKTAGEIFTDSEQNSEIKSVTMHEIFKNEKSLSKAPDIEIWRFINELASPGISPIAAQIKLKEESGKIIPEISGTAVFSGDEFIGFLDGEETLDMQLVQDKVKGGVLVQKEQGQEGEQRIALEIFDNKTKIEPLTAENGKIAISITTKTDVAIDEIGGVDNYIEDGLREKLEQDVENALKQDLENHIERVQSEFGADIFGFGNQIYKDYPDLWKSIAEDWPALFKELKVTVEPDVHIRNSAMHSKTVPVGD